MRPLELELANFRSYERERVDWRGHDLVVIAGDTGAGKTSLLDAICFALYGRTPEITGPGELLTIGRDNGEVRLTVQIAAQTWRVTRRFGKRAPQPQHLLERLVEDGGEVAETIVGKDAVDGRAKDLVGLTYEAFTSTVLLAQGQFARFFASRGAERDEILREIFGVQSMDGVRAAALRLEAAHLARADTLTSEADRSGDGAGALSAAAKAARAAAGRLAALRGLGPTFATWVARREDEATLEDERRLVARAIDVMPTTEARRVASTREADARAALITQANERDLARDERARAASALVDAESRLGRAVDLAAVRSSAERHAALVVDVPRRRTELAQAHGALQSRVEALAQLEAHLAATRAAHDALIARAAAVTALDGALRNLDAARAAMVEALRQRDVAGDRVGASEARLLETRTVNDRAIQVAQAAHIRSGLHPGDDCPVCGGQIGFLPGLNAPVGDATAELRAAERDGMEAHRQLAARQAELARFEQGRAEAEAAVDGARNLLPEGIHDDRVSEVMLQGEIATLADAMRGPAAEATSEREAVTREAGRIQEVAEHVERDGEELGVLAAALEPHGGRDGIGAIVASLAQLEALAERGTAADRELLRVESTLAEAERAAATIEATLIRPLRVAAAVAAESAGLAPPPADLSAEALNQACDALERRLTEHAADIDNRRAALRLQSDAQGSWLAERCASLRLARPDDLPQATERAQLDHASARSRFGHARDCAAEARRRRRDARESREQAERFRVVALDLRADRFPRYLLQRYRERLALAASERLQDLSRGAYRFAASEPDPLAIVDTRRGEATRGVATLSGGERFLASLSLALALGDIAAGAGGRLDCLFLDEGFSTLDADSLELAIAGIERLSGGGRLIGVITHLPGVAERLGAAIRIVKDPSGVSRVLAEGLAA